MNIDTDLQWASWKGILDYYNEKQGFLQSQIGNPKDPDGPNKNSMIQGFGCAKLKRVL